MQGLRGRDVQALLVRRVEGPQHGLAGDRVDEAGNSANLAPYHSHSCAGKQAEHQRSTSTGYGHQVPKAVQHGVRGADTSTTFDH
ncbi:hypothetical protein GCM10018963_62670 [Saccharothrix longispora]